MDPSLPPAPGVGPRSARAQVEDLADRLGTSPVAVVVGAVVVLVALGVIATRLLAWGQESPPELTIPYAASADPAPTSGTAVTTSTTAPVDVLAHAAGAVARPGVYSLPSGSRVGDLLAASGGPVADADVDRLNLAAPLVDGARVYVPVVGEVMPPAVLGPDVADDGMGPGSGPVDLNAADAGALEELPGVGPATAAAIVSHREQHGPFRSVDDLLEVRGIGDAKLAALRDLVTV